MSEPLSMPQDLMHHLIDTREIVLVDGKLNFSDEEKTLQRIHADIESAAAEGGYTINAE